MVWFKCSIREALDCLVAIKLVNCIRCPVTLYILEVWRSWITIFNKYSNHLCKFCPSDSLVRFKCSIRVTTDEALRYCKVDFIRIPFVVGILKLGSWVLRKFFSIVNKAYKHPNSFCSCNFLARFKCSVRIACYIRRWVYFSSNFCFLTCYLNFSRSGNFSRFLSFNLNSFSCF